MARLVGDIGCESGSEDEFPSLQELVATRGQRSLGSKVKSNLHSTHDEDGGKRVKSPGKKTVKSQEGTARSAKAQPRKRVLNQKSDNPLLRPFDSASSDLLEKGERRKGRGAVGKMWKKDAKTIEEEASGKQDEEKDDARSAQRKGSELRESGESEIDNLVQARSQRKDLKTTGTKLDLKARGGKAVARSPSKLVKSTEENHSDSVFESDTKASKGETPKKSDDEEGEDATEVGTTRSTAVESTSSDDEDVKQVTKPSKSRQVRKAAERPRTVTPQRVESEEDFELDSDDLSDFIVEDSDFLEEEDTVIEEPAPRSVRKLVKGRRPNRLGDSDDEELNVQMGKLKVEVDASNTIDKAFKELNLEDSDEEDLVDTRTRKNDQVPKRPKVNEDQPTSPDIDDLFTLRYSPSMNKPMKLPKETRFATPPGSPVLKPRGLVSPKKKVPRIPSTPHRPSMDSFWQQDVVNDWNDEYSPRKVILPQSKFPAEDSDSIDPLLHSPGKSSLKAVELRKESKKCFDLRKHSLAEKFVLELDTKVTNGEITRLSQETGGVRIIWSKTLQSTAGRAIWRRESIRTAANPHVLIYRHHASIELAEKVIDDENRLLNTVAHEFCHLTTYMIDNVKTNPHGKNFKAWGAKVTDMFRGLGIQVSTKHSYAIDYKYIWQCERCSTEYQRHSKSIDPSRQGCKCKGRLIQVKPAPKSRIGSDGKEKTLTEYQLYVKENMSKVKQANPGSPQKEIMSLVGKSYKEYKASKATGGTTTVEVVDMLGGAESRQVTPEEDRTAFVSRKLDFLDLTTD